MSFDAAINLFYVAGWSMLLNLGLSLVVSRALSTADYRAIRDELFAVPNRLLGTPDLFRLLRVRYFLPFRALPDGASELEPWVLATLWAARFSGLCFVCAILGFFVAMFAAAGA